LGGLAGAATGLKSPSDQYVAFLKSRAVADRLIERFGLIRYFEADVPGDARKALENATRISSGKDGLITVEFDDKDPAFAAKVANAYVEELGGLLDRLAVTEAQQRRLFFEKQLKQTKDALTLAEQSLQASGVGASALKIQPQAAVEAVARVQAEIAAQEVKVASLRGYLADTAPEFKQSLTELAAMRAQLRKLEGNSTAQSGEGSPAQSDYIARFREFKYQETLFELFSRQYEIARIDESREGAVIQVLDLAVPPDRKAKPQKALIAVLATLAKGFVLLLFVFVRQAVRNAGQDPESAQKLQSIRRSLGFR
jgi:tyrosine-protein kinase Etk/Wzc